MRLKQILMKKGMRATELARILNVSPSYVNSICRGTTNVSTKKCEEIAKILNVPIAALFDGYCEPGYVYCPHCGKPITLHKDED